MLACLVARSLVRACWRADLSNKVSHKHSYVRILYLLNVCSFHNWDFIIYFITQIISNEIYDWSVPNESLGRCALVWPTCTSHIKGRSTHTWRQIISDILWHNSILIIYTLIWLICPKWIVGPVCPCMTHLYQSHKGSEYPYMKTNNKWYPMTQLHFNYLHLNLINLLNI